MIIPSKIKYISPFTSRGDGMVWVHVNGTIYVMDQKMRIIRGGKSRSIDYRVT